MCSTIPVVPKRRRGEIEIHASSFIPGEEQGELKPIETDAEWELIEEMLETFLGDENE